MRRYLRSGALLVVAAVAAFAVASAQGARPPAPSLNFTEGPQYFYSPIGAGGTTHSFVLQFSGKGNTGTLSTDFSITTGSGFVLGTDGCTGQVLSAKTRTCTIDVTYSYNSSQPLVDWATLTATGSKLSATINLRGESMNHSPTATGQSVLVTEDTAETITLSGSDSDGQSLTFSKGTGPSHGTLGAIGTPACSSGACTATVVYTPASGYTGSDAFTFRVNDGTSYSFPGTVSIVVIPSGGAPWADSMSTWYVTDTPRTITLTGGDPNGDEIGFEIVTPPSNGTLSQITSGGCSGTAPLFCDAQVTYTPDPGSEAPDSFTFRTYEYDGPNISSDATVSLGLS